MKALIIQDDKKSSDDITQAFQICLPEAELVYTNSGIEGIHLCKSISIELVILDMSITDLSGFDILRAIRQLSQVPVIILSLSKDETDIVKSLELGADVYLTKPLRQLEFMAYVRSLNKKSDNSQNNLNISFRMKNRRLPIGNK